MFVIMTTSTWMGKIQYLIDILEYTICIYMLYDTILYFTILYFTTLYYTALYYNTTLYSTLLYSTIQFYTLLYITILYLSKSILTYTYFILKTYTYTYANTKTNTNTNTNTNTKTNIIYYTHLHSWSIIEMSEDVSSTNWTEETATLLTRQARYARLGRLVACHAVVLNRFFNWWATHCYVMFCDVHVLPTLQLYQLYPFDPCTLHLSAVFVPGPDPINCSCGGRWFKGY